jgi:hypothetical protein
MREDQQHIEKECGDMLFHLEKQKMDLEQEQYDKRIMEIDTSTMDKESQLYFKLITRFWCASLEAGSSISVHIISMTKMNQSSLLDM